jgi:predicted DCC family thiol-disulfide oxidoreductase YuxK
MQYSRKICGQAREGSLILQQTQSTRLIPDSVRPGPLCRSMDRFVFERSWLGDVPPPRRPLLMFDCGCPFCRAAARLVARLDRRERLALLSRDDEAAAPYTSRIPEDQIAESWQVIEPTGVRLMHGPGIRLLEYIPATRWLGWVLRSLRLTSMHASNCVERMTSSPTSAWRRSPSAHASSWKRPASMLAGAPSILSVS